MTVDSAGLAVWIGRDGQGWLHPQAIEIRVVNTSNVQSVPWKGPSIVVTASDGVAWVSGDAGRRACKLAEAIVELASPDRDPSTLMAKSQPYAPPRERPSPCHDNHPAKCC